MRTAAPPDALELKRRVRGFWNARPCGSGVSRAELGSPAFFAEVERHRYDQEPHIPRVVGFGRWRGRDVLEIGCGLGTDLVQFARTGAHVTGIDLTPRAVELTSRRFALEGLAGRFAVGDAEQLEFEDESFDLVYSNGVLHHTPDTAQAVREIHRVLRPGGRAIVMLYHRHSYNYLVNILALRRTALALLRRGWPAERLARLTGTDPEVLREYERLVRGQAAWGARELLNNNTDGAGNPLSQVFSRSEARRLFHAFRAVETQVHWLVKKNVPLLGRYLPIAVDRALGRAVGWALYVLATK